ncbi:ATP dependent DNA ligase [Phanerochaete sordida]|uniref:ATP dependent DNA ligase n=1 Tax=Phanerochaete sordida TaxID=48140 RepID=A0A9P3LCU8_9APHY|nr:ATP dependent DNA ligase [Phanerochaete sordida]
MELQQFRGCLVLVGPTVDEFAHNADTSDYTFPPTDCSYHITLVTKGELRSLSQSSSTQDILRRLQSAYGDEHPRIYSLGVGAHPQHKPEVFFVPVVWAKGQQLRKLLGLPPKHFHITLSRQDAHDVDKGIASLLRPLSPDAAAELLDHLVFTLHSFGDHPRSKEYSIKLCASYSSSEKGFLRLGDSALQLGEHKLAMLSYACAHRRTTDAKLKEYCIRRIITCAQETEWGTICTEWELDQLPEALCEHLVQPWSSEVLAALEGLTSTASTLCHHSREKLFIRAPMQSSEPWYRLPRFFRWLVPFKVAVMSTPRNSTDIAALGSPHIGIRHIITLTEETPLEPEWFAGSRVTNTFLPIPNYHPPTIEQMDLIIKLLCDEENLPVLIHCGGGKGRAGTVVACLLVAFGFNAPRLDYSLTQPAMSAPEAIAALRDIRPGSIETEQQEAFVGKWASTIWKRQSLFPESVPEPLPCPLEIEGTLGPSSNLFIFVGLPGSGKSWISRSLLARDSSGWDWISQDDSGSRSACETAIGHARGKTRVILDRCNTSRADRAAWLALAAHWAVSPVCVYFDYPATLCTHRAQNRAGHPTLPPGPRVRNAVAQMQKQLDVPSLDEGFTAIVTVCSFAAAAELVTRLSPAVTLFKFPRTPHLLNLGAATQDDIVCALPPAGAAHVVITEKVDGANMGFALTPDGLQLLAQNRAHYVHAASHAQFRRLDAWLDAHGGALRRVLGRDAHFAARYVLFGEWLAATHSVAYTRLPDWFLAFDLYDRTTRSWADRRTLEARLAGTGIGLVPVLYQGPMPAEDELRCMVQQQSRFTDGRVEGVYVKTERGGKVVGRGKVVRSDFIAGNEHWTKGPLRANELESHNA